MEWSDITDGAGEKIREGAKAAVKQPIILGVVLGLLSIKPVAAQGGGAGIGEALCGAGLDVILQALLFLAVLTLVLLSFGDIFRALKGQQGNARRRQQSGGHAASAGKKFFGAVILAALPTILTSMGFSMVSCFGDISVDLFAGGP